MSAAAAAEPVLPDGCTDLMWIDGVLVVAGPDTEPNRIGLRGNRYVAVRFAPGIGPAVFGVPAAELVNARPRLGDVWTDARAGRLADRISNTPEEEQGTALDRLVAGLVSRADRDPLAPAVVRLLHAGGSPRSIADQLGVGPRLLHRRCLAAFGYGPQLLGRILRFRSALERAREGDRLADVAARTGYADQAHLARETRRFAGTSMRGLA